MSGTGLWTSRWTAIKEGAGFVSIVIGIITGVIDLLGKLPSVSWASVRWNWLLIVSAALVTLGVALSWNTPIVQRLVRQIRSFARRVAGSLAIVNLIAMVILVFVTAGLISSSSQVAKFTARQAELAARSVAIATKNEEVASKNLEIERLHTTKFVGSFPEDVKKIFESVNGLLRQTESEALILVDFPSYGNFTAPESNRAYRDEINKLITKKLKVHMVCYTRKKAKTATEDQFRPYKDRRAFDNFRRQPEWVNFFTYNSLEAPNDIEEFVNILCDLDYRYFKNNLKDRISILSNIKDMPGSIWISDQKESIFSFYTFEENRVREVAFRTTDSNLIGALKAVFYSHYNGGVDYESSDH